MGRRAFSQMHCILGRVIQADQTPAPVVSFFDPVLEM